MIEGPLDGLMKTFCRQLSRNVIFKFEINQFMEILNKKRKEVGYSDVSFAQYRESLTGKPKETSEPKPSKSDTSSQNEEPVTMRETRSRRQSKASEPEKKTASKKDVAKKELNPGRKGFSFSFVSVNLQFLQLSMMRILHIQMFMDLFTFFDSFINSLFVNLMKCQFLFIIFMLQF